MGLVAARGRSAQEPSGAAPRAAEPRTAEPRAAEPRTTEPPGAEPPKPEWKPVVTPVEETGGGPRPGIGQRRGNLAHLSANPRMRIWQLRAVVAVVILAAFWALVSWKLGLTLAVIAIIADTIYRARKGYAGKIKLTAAQRRTRRQLTKLGRAGYRAMHARPIPESQDQIDHLVVGPAGVFAIDSENWDKRLAVRTKNGTQLWHGPFSKKDRLQHAQWEAQRAAEMLSGEIGKPVTRPRGDGGLRAEDPLGRGHHPGSRRLQRPAAAQVPAPAGQAGRRQAADRRGDRAHLHGRQPGVPASQLGFPGQLIRAFRLVRPR